MSNNRKKELPVERITLKSIGEQLLSIFNLERGLLFTFWELLLRPGQAIEAYLFTTQREQFVKPLNFLLLTSGLVIFFLVKLDLGTDDLETFDWAFWESQEDTEARLLIILDKIKEYGNAIQLLSIPLVAMVSYQILKGKEYNFAEHLVINTYIASIQSLISLLIVLLSFWDTRIASMFGLFVLLYFLFAYRSVFKIKGTKGILQIIAVFLGSQLLQVIIVGLALTLYFFLNPLSSTAH